jgi:hypothetical protein
MANLDWAVLVLGPALTTHQRPDMVGPPALRNLHRVRDEHPKTTTAPRYATCRKRNEGQWRRTPRRPSLTELVVRGEGLVASRGCDQARCRVYQARAPRRHPGSARRPARDSGVRGASVAASGDRRSGEGSPIAGHISCRRETGLWKTGFGARSHARLPSFVAAPVSSWRRGEGARVAARAPSVHGSGAL